MSLKILHTSDWHIGKQLLKTDFHDDMELFFDWLIQVISDEKIDILLMSGDLFDQANPSQQALRQYYLFLKRMVKLNCKVIITGGNHDAPQVLNAPKELLEIIDVTIIGGAPENIADLFIPIEKNNQKVVIAAVPYLRDKDIRNANAGESYSDKIEQIKNGLANYFENISNFHQENYSDSKLIVMAHLYAQGAETTESEREIQIGNQAGIEATIFGNNTTYVALGHIHKPQDVGNQNVLYSGSPIPLSFSEKDDTKRILILKFNEPDFEIVSKEIPAFRKLITLKGTLEEVENKLKNYKKTSILEDLIELQIIEKEESIVKIKALEALQSSEMNNGFQIVKAKIEFKNKIKGTASLLQATDDVSQYQPIDIFKKRVEQDAQLEEAEIEELMNAFKELIENRN